MPCRIGRRGFTLIELLVVIAIIGVLVGMLLPAVQKAREAASRTQCRNHLKQVGLALLSYHNDFASFPPGYISAVAPDGTETGPGWGWAAHILPHLEQQNLHTQINFKVEIGHDAHAAARVRTLPVLRCPSDTSPDTFRPEGTEMEVAHASYVAVFGNNEIEDNPGAGNGIFYRNSRTRIADITDGTSNTLLIGERSGNLALATWTGAVTGAEEAPALVLGSADHTPNHPAAHPEDFWSRHVQGVHFLFADGSVRTISNSISPAAWAAIATRAGGETYSASDF